MTNLGNVSVFPSDLIIGETYTWEMGAEYMPCIYKGKGKKVMTYVFQLGMSEHTLSYGDVYKYISPRQEEI